jgi:hypothetical protein
MTARRGAECGSLTGSTRIGQAAGGGTAIA